MKTLLLTIILLQACAAINYKLFNDFESQRQLMLYCESSEGNIKKQAGIKLLQIAASKFVSLELNRGFCEQYYVHREPANGYLYFRTDYEEHYRKKN